MGMIEVSFNFQAAYNDALHKKQYDIMIKTEEDALEFARTKEANEVYNRRMADKRYQNTLRVKWDLEKQIEEKNRRMVSEWIIIVVY